MSKASCVLLFLFLFSCKQSSKIIGNVVDAFNYSSTKVVHASHGAVVCAHPLASEAGLNAMQEGGNAFDAAIATQFALAVVYPGAGNIGGGGFMVARKANGEMVTLDYRETAPSRAHRDMYLDAQGNVIPGKSIRGAGAAGVPGSVAGIFETIKLAKLPLEKLISPAIELAENGFAITENEAASLNRLQNEFAKYNSSPTAFQRSVRWKKGDMLVQKELAATLRRILKDGAKGFYEGETAQLIADEMQRGGGFMNALDLKNYNAKWRAPHRFNYKGYEIVSMGPPSSGGILLHQMFGMVAKRNLAQYKPLSAAAVHLMTEAERRAFADRAQYLGDADFYKVPVEEITDQTYLDQRMSDYQADKAGNSDITKAGKLPGYESKETTHISIVDKQGNAVAITTTLNDSYGCKTVVKGAGFFLNNEMDDFSTKPGVPNLYGAIGGEANAIAPGKRMLSSMSPTIVLKDNQLFLVVGTPGGTTIPTSVFQTIADIIDFGMNAEEAVNLPKFHHQWVPDEIRIEENFPDTTRMSLEKMGYKCVDGGSIGRTEVIMKMEDNTFEAVADSRGDDSAAGN
jgi:gamma-glutamyltranspeptidase/glutathione hydrolase